MSDSTNVRPVINLNIPDINNNLLISAFTGVIKYRAHYSQRFSSYLENADAAVFHELQHDLLDIYPAILNVQIRELFTTKGKTNGRFRLHKLSEVYHALLQLLTATALADLWDVVADREQTNQLHISDEQRKALRQFIYSMPVEKKKTDSFQLLSGICSVFVDNNTAPFMDELIELEKAWNSNKELYDAYQFFESDLALRFQQENISDEEITDLCQIAEKHLGQLLQTTAFLVNYEIIRIKDISVKYPDRRGGPTYVQQKTAISGREYPTSNQQPVSNSNNINDHAIYITRNDKTDLLPLNLSPFLIDQNAFKGQKNYLPKLYLFAGIGKEGQVYYNHVDTPSLHFILTVESISIQHAYLNQLFLNLQDFCKDLGL